MRHTCFDRRVLLFALAMALPFVARTGYAAEYHVSPSGSDTASGTLDRPWRTLGKANSTLEAGDAVLIHAGTYDEVINPQRDGTSDTERVTYRVAGDGDVTLTSFPSWQSGPGDGALPLGLKRYITVSGRPPGGSDDTRQLKLRMTRTANSYGNVCGSEGVIVENVEMTPGDGQAPSRGFAFCLNFWSGNYETKYNVLRNCRIVGVSSPPSSSVAYTEDLVTVAKNAHHNVIDNNELELVRHSVVYMDSPASHSNVVRNNRIISPEHTALSIWSAGVDHSDGARILVENNWLEASARTTDPDGGPGNAFQWGSDEVIIRHNVITQGGAANTQVSSVSGLAGATSTSYGAPYFATDGRVYNNTIVKNRGFAVGMFNFGVDPVDLGRHRYVNNILYDSRGENAAGELVTYWTGFDTGADRYVANVFGNPGGSAAQNIMNIGRGAASLATAIADYRNPADPEFSAWNEFDNVYDADLDTNTFTDYANDQFAIKSSSPHVDAGAPLTQVAIGDAGTGTLLRVDDSRFFFAEASEFPAWMNVQTEWIAVGTTVATATKVQIASVDDATNTITLSQSIARAPTDFVWLWKDSDGSTVISGAGPDIGASEHNAGSQNAPPAPPRNLRVQ